MNDSAGTGQVPEEGGRQFGMALLAGLAVVLVLAGIVYLLVRSDSKSSPQTVALPMGAAEQAYAPQVTFSDFEMSRAENFLKQQVTYIVGIVSNNGPRNIVAMDVTLEFHDIPQNAVLRETQRIINSDGTPLAAGAKREFQLSLENIPDEWDRRPPTFVITGLQLQ
jgi:hypothetical protein